jgi:hypothetical protein
MVELNATLDVSALEEQSPLTIANFVQIPAVGPSRVWNRVARPSWAILTRTRASRSQIPSRKPS